MPNPTDKVEEALVDALELIGDTDLARAAGMVFHDVQAEVIPLIADDEGVQLAFPTMVIRPDIRTECLAVITDTQVIVAWRKGLFKKQTLTHVVPRPAINDVTVGAGSGSLSRARLLTITSDGPPCVVSLPLGTPEFEAHVRQLLEPA